MLISLFRRIYLLCFFTCAALIVEDRLSSVTMSLFWMALLSNRNFSGWSIYLVSLAVLPYCWSLLFVRLWLLLLVYDGMLEKLDLFILISLFLGVFLMPVDLPKSGMSKFRS